MKGLQNQYRTPGIGAPMAASVAPPPAHAQGIQIAPRLRIPSTALLEIPQARQQLAGGALRGTLAIHTIFNADTVRIGGQRVPLEFDQTAARAYSLVESRAWANEYRGFVRGDLRQGGEDTRLAALEPHRRGRMPVVLIHGTASSPFRWADMVNDLTEDPRIRENFEFWFFAYATGNPIPYSALLLRESLQAAVQGLGGEAADPALGRMVLVGHSQGGLLARMVTMDAGTRLWDAVSRRPLDELRMDSLRPRLASPGAVRGAPAAGRTGHLHRHPSRRQLPDRVLRHPAPRPTGQVARRPSPGSSVDAFAGNADAFTYRHLPLAPRQPLRHDPGQPLHPGASRGCRCRPPCAPTPSSRRSGMARSPSAATASCATRARIWTGSKSELVVASSHSVQSNSAAIEEVRRILLLQLAEPCPRGACRASPAVARAR